MAGTEKEKRLLELRRRTLAQNRARYGWAGVTMEGSPLLVQQEAAKNITVDAAMENYNTQIEAQAALTGAESEAQILLAKGRAAREAGRLRAGQELFSGAGQIASTALSVELAKNA